MIVNFRHIHQPAPQHGPVGRHSLLQHGRLKNDSSRGVGRISEDGLRALED